MFCCLFKLSSSFSLCIYEGTNKPNCEGGDAVEFLDVGTIETPAFYDELYLSKTKRSLKLSLNLFGPKVTIHPQDFDKSLVISSTSYMNYFPEFKLEGNIDISVTGLLPRDYEKTSGLSKSQIKFMKIIIDKSTTVTQTKQNEFTFMDKQVLNMESAGFYCLNNIKLTINTKTSSETPITIETAKNSNVELTTQLPIEQISIQKNSSLKLTDTKGLKKHMLALLMYFSYDEPSFLEIPDESIFEFPLVQFFYVEDPGSQAFIPLLQLIKYKQGKGTLVPQETEIKIIRNGGVYNKRKINYNFNIQNINNTYFLSTTSEMYCLGKSCDELENFTHLTDNEMKLRRDIRFLNIDGIYNIDSDQIDGGLYLSGNGTLSVSCNSGQLPKVTTAGTVNITFTGSVAYDGKFNSFVETDLNKLFVVTGSTVFVTLLSNDCVNVSTEQHFAVFKFNSGINLEFYGNENVEIGGSKGYMIERLSMMDGVFQLSSVSLKYVTILSGTTVFLNDGISFESDISSLSIQVHIAKTSDVIVNKFIKQTPSLIYFRYNRKDDLKPKDPITINNYSVRVLSGECENLLSKVDTNSFYADYEENLMMINVSTAGKQASLLFNLIPNDNEKRYAFKACYNPGEHGMKCPAGYRHIRTLQKMRILDRLFICDNAFTTTKYIADKIFVSSSNPQLWFSVLVDKEIKELTTKQVSVFAYDIRGKPAPINYLISQGYDTVIGRINKIKITESASLTVRGAIDLSGTNLEMTSTSLFRNDAAIISKPDAVYIHGKLTPGRTFLSGVNEGWYNISAADNGTLYLNNYANGDCVISAPPQSLFGEDEVRFDKEL